MIECVRRGIGQQEMQSERGYQFLSRCFPVKFRSRIQPRSFGHRFHPYWYRCIMTYEISLRILTRHTSLQMLQLDRRSTMRSQHYSLKIAKGKNLTLRAPNDASTKTRRNSSTAARTLNSSLDSMRRCSFGSCPGPGSSPGG